MHGLYGLLYVWKVIYFSLSFNQHISASTENQWTCGWTPAETVLLIQADSTAHIFESAFSSECFLFCVGTTLKLPALTQHINQHRSVFY